METANKKTEQVTLPIQEQLQMQKELCLQARCKLIGTRGCVLEGLLPLPQRINMAEPCSKAVAQQPQRQRKSVA